VIGVTKVVLFESFDGQVGTHIGRRCRRPLSDREVQPMHREGIGQGGRFEVDIEAPVEMGRRDTVDSPGALAVRLQHGGSPTEG
jgi:hypothetical protein